MAPTRLLAALGAMIVAAGIGFWAASATLTAPEVEAHATPTPRYEVEQGTLQRSLSFTATAKWDRKLAGRGGGQGVVTHLSLNSAVPAADGARLLEINERPVVLAQGVVPM
ncbi:MAG: hypothetical protein ABIR39_19170, partial [Nocardioides sp.]|uniref:hypothetical protein n=1 Tax=Nocardioides sp. TaxID=35761 RepID=UPI003266BAC1